MIVMIATPLGAELAARIGAAPVVADLIYAPELLPPVRFPNDHAGDPSFRRDAAATARWDAALARADALYGLPGDSAAGLAQALATGPQIRFVQGTAAGAGAQVQAAGLSSDVLARVAFASAAGVHGGTLAEFVFYGLLALRKDARRLAAVRAARAWDHYAMGELEGSTLAIVGLGGIGRAIAVRARAFGMQVIGVTRTGAAHPLADACVATADLASAFARCDAVAITLPGTDFTRALVDARALEALPAHAIVANVGRGSVIDQAALTAMLRSGRLAGAVLDVFEPEPLPPDDPLWTLENVIFSPHTAALSLRENDRIVDVFVDNLTRLADGRPLRNRIDTTEFY